MDVEPHASVSGFFQEVVSAALDRQSVEATESATFYLVGLLGEFTKGQLPDQPLSLMLARATAPAERVKVLKEVGDTSLYLTGFFADSLNRKLVASDFYVGLGEAAYRELAGRLSGSKSVREVYEELAAKFPRFVDVLAEVRGQVSFVGSDVGQLYEQWARTRSEWVERRLRKLGMLVGPSDVGCAYFPTARIHAMAAVEAALAE